MVPRSCASTGEGGITQTRGVEKKKTNVQLSNIHLGAIQSASKESRRSRDASPASACSQCKSMCPGATGALGEECGGGGDIHGMSRNGTALERRLVVEEPLG